MAKETCETVVLRVLKSAGATVQSIERSKHVKIKWCYRSQKRLSVLASTSSDHRSMSNARALVRRQIREIDSA